MALILATGSVSLVKAAYTSGNPAIGVGPGNVPVYIGKSADVRFAVEQILLSKLFDNGTICASEQAIVVSHYNAAEVRREFIHQGAYFLSPEEIVKSRKNRIQQGRAVDECGGDREAGDHHSRNGRDKCSCRNALSHCSDGKLTGWH